MKEVKKIVGQIDAKRKTIERLKADLEAARVSVTQADRHAPKLEELRLERRDLMARAMIAKKPANTQTIDAQLKTLEAQHALAQEEAQSAGDAVNIIAHGIDIEETELDQLTEQLRQAIRDELITRHDEASVKYAEAVTKLGDVVAEMVAAERAWVHVVTQVMRENGAGADFPRRGSQILEDIRNTGVRVPVSASLLADPKVAAEYVPGYENVWFVPRWADLRTPGFADQQVAEIVGSLRDAGVSAHPFTPYTPPVPETQLKVRIVRGTIQGSPKIQRDPLSGKIISSESVDFSKGEDVMIDETLARQLRKVGMVLIHNEDEMPAPPSEEETPKRVEVSKPRNTHRVIADGDIVAGLR